MVAPKSIWAFASCTGLLWWSLGASGAAADSILSGRVTDEVTGYPVAAAQIQVKYSGQTVGTATTDADGFYRAPFTVPAEAPSLVTMNVSAQSTAYAAKDSTFQVRAGTPVQAITNLSVYPTGVEECRSQTSPSVVVGNFLAPLGENFAELSRRVAQSLEFALNTQLQAVRVTLEHPPSFEPCEVAKPRTPVLGAKFALALRADAFVAGNVAKTDGASTFTVSLYVSDAYGLLNSPAVAANKSVDLNNPSGASLTAETHVAVLAAIAAGLANRKDCESAITVLSVAERLVAAVPQYVADLRKKCQASLPNAGLRRPAP